MSGPSSEEALAGAAGARSPTPRVALIGSRGVPAAYGGYETLMAELAPRLVARGFEVLIYCRSHYTPRTRREFGGARLVVLPTLRTKHLDTPVHTLLSTLDAWRRGLDAAVVVNGANAVFVPLLRLARIPTAIHVDGIEANRAKWGPVGRAVYRLSERFAGTVADLVITDAEVIRRHYLERYGVDSMMIPYGVDPRAPEGRDVLERLGLRPRGYFLYVSRFEPENNPHRVVAAYRTVPGELPLVMVGSAPYADRFVDELKRSADGRVLFPGAIYGNGYRQLQSEALAYIQATEVGGTHPALVEAMGYGNCILANDTPENREVAGDAALYFEAHRPATLAAQLALVLREPERIASLRLSALERASRRFSWEAVTDAYCTAFEYLIETRRSGKAKIQGVSTDPR